MVLGVDTAIVWSRNYVTSEEIKNQYFICSKKFQWQFNGVMLHLFLEQLAPPVTWMKYLTLYINFYNYNILIHTSQFHLRKKKSFFERIKLIFHNIEKFKKEILRPILNQFFHQEETTRIWIILDSQTLVVLVWCPPFVPGVILHLTSYEF